MIRSKEYSNEWYTPKYIFDALGCKFDMDVASPVSLEHVNISTDTFITTNSLERDWKGFVWMNPPFGHQKDKFLWLNKFIDHGNGIALTPDRTSAPWWQYSAKKMDAILFVAGKIKFIKPDGTLGEQPGNGTTLFAIGNEGVSALIKAQQNGLGTLLINKP